VRTLVQEASSDLEAGSDIDAQRKMERLLERYPDYATEEIVSTLGGQVRGLPKVLTALESANPSLNSASSQTPTPLSAVRVALLTLPTVQAAEQVDRFFTQGHGSDAAHLWRGRLALQQGEFPLAKQHFDVFWDSQGVSSRRELVRAVKASISRLDIKDPRDACSTTAEAFLWRGLVDEAVDYATGQLPADNAQAMFFAAVRDDLRGAHEEAARGYAAVLKALPNHFLAARRLARLEPVSAGERAPGYYAHE